MKRIFYALVFLCLLVGQVQAASPVSCPPFQHDNGAGACEFNNYLDTPGFLAQQNKVIAESLNANPEAPAFSFARQYGSLPINQQFAVMNCQVAGFNALYFNIPLASDCPTLNGQIDVAAIIAAHPASTNPGNQPSVVFNGSTNKFDPATPPQAGPAVPIFVRPPVGASIVGAKNGSIFSVGGAAKDAGIKEGDRVTENGVSYIFHGGMGMMGFGGYFTLAP